MGTVSAVNGWDIRPIESVHGTVEQLFMVTWGQAPVLGFHELLQGPTAATSPQSREGSCLSNLHFGVRLIYVRSSEPGTPCSGRQMEAEQRPRQNRTRAVQICVRVLTNIWSPLLIFQEQRLHIL